jgi:hypothetical protein
VNTVLTDANGVATARAFTANTRAGSFSVIAKVSLSVGTQFDLTNLPGAPATIAATAGTPQSTTVGTAYPTALQATVTDAYGNAVPGVTVTFTPPAAGPGGSFAGGLNTAVTDTNGVATAGPLPPAAPPAVTRFPQRSPGCPRRPSP